MISFKILTEKTYKMFRSKKCPPMKFFIKKKNDLHVNLFDEMDFQLSYEKTDFRRS